MVDLYLFRFCLLILRVQPKSWLYIFNLIIVACCSSISFTIFFHLCYHIYVEVDAYSYFCQVTRLREYQGVDPHFDTIARQYHDIVKVHV